MGPQLIGPMAGRPCPSACPLGCLWLSKAGWRGFAWPRLRQRHTLAGAALLLAVPWMLWHLSTFWLDTGLRGFSLLLLPGFFVGMAAGAVVLGWLYEHAHSRILAVALFHACLNMARATPRAPRGSPPPWSRSW